jgi:hypothetical protein
MKRRRPGLGRRFFHRNFEGRGRVTNTLSINTEPTKIFPSKEHYCPKRKGAALADSAKVASCRSSLGMRHGARCPRPWSMRHQINSPRRAHETQSDQLAANYLAFVKHLFECRYVLASQPRPFSCLTTKGVATQHGVFSPFLCLSIRLGSGYGLRDKPTSFPFVWRSA